MCWPRKNGWLVRWGCLLSNWRLSKHTAVFQCFHIIPTWRSSTSIWINWTIGVFLSLFKEACGKIISLLKNPWALDQPWIIEISRSWLRYIQAGIQTKLRKGKLLRCTWQGVFFPWCWLTNQNLYVDLRWIEGRIDFEWLVTGLHPS